MFLVLFFYSFFFFFNDTATTEIYTLSLHDALPILGALIRGSAPVLHRPAAATEAHLRSEEHTSELQSRFDIVCRLLLEKKKTIRAVGQRWRWTGDEGTVLSLRPV